MAKMPSVTLPSSSLSSITTDWDPVTNSDEKEVASHQCLLRIKRYINIISIDQELMRCIQPICPHFLGPCDDDIFKSKVEKQWWDMMSIYNEPPPGLFVVPDEKDMTIIHALITGSFDTPYEGGFFYFLIRCPSDYPIRPPRVKLMTTGAGTVRFNPNLYKCGKICLSILGTWTGPSWSPAQSLSSVLISIQSLLNEKPYHNEPGFERERCPGDIGRYNDIIQHETLRVAVCGMLENDTCLAIPDALSEVMDKTFLEFYDYYESTVRKKLHLHGQHMQDPFGEERGTFQYRNILTRLQALHAKLSAKCNNIGALGDKTTSDNECSSDDSDLDQPDEPPHLSNS